MDTLFLRSYSRDRRVIRSEGKMKSHYGQYPEIYSADDTRYTFFYDSGERVTLIAGEDGITQEWIHALKLEHRKEYNMLRRGVRGDITSHVFSLDQYMDNADDKSEVLADPDANVEANYIAGIEAVERRERIRKALANLTDAQRELLIRVRVQGVSISAVAREQMVDESAVRRRIERIEKKLKKF